MTTSVIYWRRLDVPGLERLELSIESDRITACSDLICLEDGGYRLEYRWQLDPEWRTLSVEFNRKSAAGQTVMRLERAGQSWNVDGAFRPDLTSALEPDLSATPFCNSIAIRGVFGAREKTLTLDTAFIDASTLAVTRSRQRYDRQSANRFRYTDLGIFQGFEADLLVDASGLIELYEGLFERVMPQQ